MPISLREKRILIAANDPGLTPLLEAEEGLERDEILGRLVTDKATPVIERTLLRHHRTFGAASVERDDIVSSIRVRLIHKLRRVCASREAAIKSFADYVATVTFNALYDTMRRRFPERTRFRNRLRYALLHDDRMLLFQHVQGSACALQGWPAAVEIGEVPVLGRELTNRLVDRDHLGKAVYELLRAAGHPLLLDDVVEVFVELWKIAEDEAPAPPQTVVDPGATPHALAENRQYLRGVLEEVRTLPAPQRAALLLNLRDSDGGSAVGFFILSCAVTFDALAQLMDLSPEDLASLWNRLPLSDLEIAERLGRTRQQVINLRKSARERLLRRLARKTGLKPSTERME
jgi:DNA-directed RNA polymerase specialized sigma24 family protein